MIYEEKVAQVFIFNERADAVDGLVWKLEDALKIKSFILNNQGNLNNLQEWWVSWRRNWEEPPALSERAWVVARPGKSD